MVDAPQRDDGLAGIRQHFAEPPHRIDHHRHQIHEHEEFADADRAGGQKVAASDQHHTQLSHRQRVADAPVPRFQRVHAVEGVPIGAVARAEAADLVLLAGEGAHHADAGEVLLQHRGHGALGFVGDLELPPHAGEEQEGAQRQKRHQADRQPRQASIAGEDDRHHHHHQQHRAPDLHHVRSQEHAHGFHVGTAALHQIARVRGVEEARWQIVQATVELVAQPPRDGFRRNGRPTSAQVEEQRPDRDQQQPGQPGQREIADERPVLHDGIAAVRPVETEDLPHLHGGSDQILGADAQIPLRDHVQRIAADDRRRQHAGAGRPDGRDGRDVAQALAAGDDPEIAPRALARFHDSPLLREHRRLAPSARERANAKQCERRFASRDGSGLRADARARTSTTP